MLKIVLALGSIVSLIALGISTWMAGITFSQQCGGHLKRAADANTVELAAQELKVAVTYLEDNNMTQGDTHVFIETPDKDLGFWYKNLKSALANLEAVTPETGELERSNLLLKLRETLLDHGQYGEEITTPPGISLFPHNVGYVWWGIFSVAALMLGIFVIPWLEKIYGC